jgi:catechol 2,3-dioxygenase-like lactoylglutathione lyase family enzyme
MHPSIKVLTLGVADLERALTFYRDGLGLETEGIFGTEFENGAVVFFNLSGGLILALWPFESMANVTGLTIEPPGPADTPRFSIGHNVRTEEEVGAILVAAERAGATFIDPPQTRPWGGTSGHFRDPDGHLWEIAWNPDLIPED